jgi:hypothetical protein
MTIRRGRAAKESRQKVALDNLRKEYTRGEDTRGCDDESKARHKKNQERIEREIMILETRVSVKASTLSK